MSPGVDNLCSDVSHRPTHVDQSRFLFQLSRPPPSQVLPVSPIPCSRVSYDRPNVNYLSNNNEPTAPSDDPQGEAGLCPTGAFVNYKHDRVAQLIPGKSDLQTRNSKCTRLGPPPPSDRPQVGISSFSDVLPPSDDPSGEVGSNPAVIQHDHNFESPRSNPHINLSALNLRNDNSRNLKCMYTNCDSIINKVNEFELTVRNNNPHIIFLTETKLNKEIINSEIFLCNAYEIYRRDRSPSDGGGGVCILVRKDLNSLIISDTFFINGCECIGCVIKISNKTILASCMYRPPSYSRDQNTMFFDQIKLLNDFNCDQFILCGDFNFGNINWLTHNISSGAPTDTSNFYDCIQDCFLEQHVHEPTRQRGQHNPSTLDLIFTKSEHEIEMIDYQPPLGASDHSLLLFSFALDVAFVPDTLNLAKLNYWKGDYVGLDNFYTNIDWDTHMADKDPVDSEKIFLKYYSDGVQKFIPILNPCPANRTKCKWITRDVILIINKKKFAWNRYRKRKTTLRYEAYCRARNEATRCVRDAKKAFEKRLAKEVKSNPQAFFGYLRSKTALKEEVTRLRNNDGTYTNSDQESCTLLNSKFKSVFIQEPVGNLPDPDYIFNGISLEDIDFDEQEVKKLLDSQKENSAPGPCGVSSKVLKRCSSSLARPIFLILKRSLDFSMLPVNWKRGNITAVYKKGPKDQPLNYRPISLTSILCKLLEKIIRKRIVDHLETNNIFTVHQHGFRSRRSCLTALLEYFEAISKLLDDGIPVDAIYLDCQKAFDTVPTKRLLKKVEAMGIKGKVLAWIREFLTGREQRVVLRGASSDWVDVLSGVPQGSVLGPVLFLIYINDIVLNLDSSIKLFADDAKLYRALRDSSDVLALQNDLNKLEAWSQKWLLKFNETKCSTIHFGHTNPLVNYTMNGKDLTVSNEEKDLGVYVSDNFKFSNHIAKIAAKANSIVGRVKRTFTFMDKEMFNCIYKTIIRPHLEYAVQSWSPHLKKDIRLLEQVQRRATAIVPELMDLQYEDRLKALGLTTLEDRRIRGDLIEVYKMIHGLTNIDCTQFFTINQNRSGASTRGHQYRLTVPQVRTERRRNFFSIRVVKHWNNLPADVVNSASLNSFKSNYDKYVRQSLSRNAQEYITP